MNLYSKRRERLMKDLGENSVAVLFSGDSIPKSEDECYPFDVNRNFYYYTGLEKESMVLLMARVSGMIREILFILPYDETQARWVGGRMLKEEVSAISDVKDVEDVSDLDGALSTYLNISRRDGFRFYFDLWHYNISHPESPALKMVKRIRDEYPAVVIRDLFPYTTRMRLIKDEYEITCFRQAIHTTKMGIEAMMKNSRPELNEMVMDGIFDFVLMQNGCKENSFKTIAASGKRATILHYSDNDQIMKDGELFLCDLGATFKHYCADISRTFPVNGKFTQRQREIYSLVLQAQKLVEENARVGVKVRDLQNMVVSFYREELPKHGLYEDVSEYYFHGISHHIGLDTHDCDGGLGAVLEPGNIISNEPGLYIASEGIGIRIEDDLLITGTGAENLSVEIMKDPDEIEAFMAK